MLRGCLLALLMYAGLAAAYIYWLDQKVDRPGSVWGGAVAGFLVLCSIGALSNGWRAWRDSRRIGAAVQTESQLVEGKLATVVGTIHPLGEALLAPFSREECVVCEYDLVSPQRINASKNTENSGSDFAGFWMNPCVIRTPFRDVKLLGYPVLEGFKERQILAYSAAANAKEFLLSNEFDDRTGVKIVGALSAFGEVWSDDDGFVRKNIRIGKVTVDEMFPPQLQRDIDDAKLAGPEAPTLLGVEEDDDRHAEALDDDLDDEDDNDESYEGSQRAPFPKMVEKRVSVGEKVCAIGVYDEVRGGLVPLSRGGQPNRLIRGDADTVMRNSRSAARGNLIGGVIGLAVIHAVIYGVFYLHAHSPDILRDRDRKATEAVRQSDIAALVPLYRRGYDLNRQDSDGNTLLHVSLTPEVTWWLLKHGANPNVANQWGDTPLIEAARYDRTEIARQLLKGGADPQRRNKQGRTALEEAEARYSNEVLQLLRDKQP